MTAASPAPQTYPIVSSAPELSCRPPKPFPVPFPVPLPVALRPGKPRDALYSETVVATTVDPNPVGTSAQSVSQYVPLSGAVTHPLRHCIGWPAARVGLSHGRGASASAFASDPPAHCRRALTLMFGFNGAGFPRATSRKYVAFPSKSRVYIHLTRVALMTVASASTVPAWPVWAWTFPRGPASRTLKET